MENHKEDILKNFLQDTFSDYEPEPSDAAWENIFAAIQPDKPSFWTKSKPWIASAVVLLTAALLWYGLGETEGDNTEIALNERRTGIESDGSLLAKISTRAEKTNIESDGSLLVKIPTRAGKSDGSLLVKIPTRAEEEIIVKSDAPKVEEGNHPIVGRQSDEVVVATDINLTASTSEQVQIMALNNGSVSGQVETLATSKKDSQTEITTSKKTQSDDSQTEITTDKKTQSDDSQTEITTDKKTQSDDSQTNTTQNTVIEQVRYIRPMESLKNKDFTLTKIDLNAPVVTPSMLTNREAKPVRQHTYMSMSITPIQTYRILTIQDQNVQNVQTNGLFDSERNGWQFDLGITKPIGKLWNFRTSLSYLRMRQWSEYQVGTDELVLRNTNYGNYNNAPSQNAPAELEIVGQTVTESKMLHMVGLKMDVQKFIKITPKNRYFLSMGTQVMYENSQKQSNIFLNVSAGFQHVISNHTFLTIEPTASYSLNNFNDSRSLLQANGYNLGLKMGVSFRVK
jgi:hypothetical protein